MVVKGAKRRATEPLTLYAGAMAAHEPAPTTICFSCYSERASIGPFCSACWGLIGQRRRELEAHGGTESFDAAIADVERHWMAISATPCSKGSGPQAPPQRR